MQRRTYLRALGVVGGAGLAGCPGGGDGTTTTPRETAETPPEATETPPAGATETPMETRTERETSTPPEDGVAFYVSPEGDDDWSGTEPAPTGDDGPFATLDRAREAVQERAGTDRSGPLRVQIRGGTYRLTEPIRFGPEDAVTGTESAPVRYEAYPGEQPVFSGGEVVEDWTETDVAGRTAWRTTLPSVRDGDRTFKQLWVDGERRYRPRLPDGVDTQFGSRETAADSDVAYFRTERGPEDPKTFVAPDVGGLESVENVELVRIKGWTCERLPVESYDEDTQRVTVGRRTAPNFDSMEPNDPWIVGEGYYYLDNVRSALGKPGQWYLDEDTGELTYLPEAGESMADTTVIAPRSGLSELVQFQGDGGYWVQHITLAGLTFEHAGWQYPPTGFTGVAATVPGTIEVGRSHDIAFEDCTVRHVGQYGVGLNRYCKDITVEGCSFEDMGAGGVTLRPGKRWEAPAAERVTVVDTHVRDVGTVFHAGAGILLKRVEDATVAHNHVHECYHGGIQVGVRPGYGEVETADNTIEKNYVHDVGGLRTQEKFGIYVTSQQPNLRILNNVVHRCWKYTPQHGGGIDLDPAVTGALVEHNVIYDSDHPFDFFFGLDNLVRNNVFVGGLDNVADAGPIADRRGETAVTPDGDANTSLTFRHNVLVAEGTPIYDDIRDDVGDVVRSDENCFWDRDREELVVANDWDTPQIDLDRWRESTGNDRNSIVADPLIETLDGTEFALADDSPAFDVGFEPIDTSDVGPRPAE